MKIKAGCIAACCAALVVSPPTGARASTGISNGSFEDGLAGWTSGANVAVKSVAPYAPTDGSALAVFNAENSTPNGWISQQIPVRNDTSRHHRLRLDVGNLGYHSIEMRLRVEVTEDLFGTIHHRVDQVVAIPGITGGSTRWQEASFDFPTPLTGTVLIRLSDVSSATTAADLVVDNVRVDDSAILTVEASENPWLTDPWLPDNEIDLSPAGIEGITAAAPPIRANYHPGTVVTVSAPAFHNLKGFLCWRKNGADYGTSPVTTVTMDADTTLVAVYDPPITVSTGPPAEARGFMGTGPFSALAWSAYITNHSGTTESWSASAELPDGSPDPVFFTVMPSHGTLAHGEYAIVKICLNKEALNLAAGTHWGRVDVTSRYSTFATGLQLTIIDPDQHVENGGFESDFDGWLPHYRVTRESAPPYQPTEGQYLVAFNTLNSTPSGTLTRTFPTETGVTYALRFDMGTLAYNTLRQDLKVEIANDTGPAFHTDYNFVNGIGGGKCHWEPRLIHFVAQSETTRITFSDVSTVTNAIDLLLDNVRVSNEGFDITVTTAADENDPVPGSGTGISLREAIAMASGAPGTNAVRFSPALDGAAITLGGTQLHLATGLTIDASGLTGGISISGNGQSRVFRNEAQATMRHLRISGGNPASDTAFPSGGGIYNSGTLMLDGCVISNNTAPDAGGAIRSSGELLLTECRIAGNHAGAIGGGIFSQGTTRLDASTIADNSAGGCGGGLACQGPFAGSWMMLDRSTVSGNTSGACGGGYSGIGGYKQYGNLHALNSTFAKNHAAGTGGAVFGNGPVMLQHCTISANTSLDPQAGSGGVSADDAVIENSIVAGNTPDLENPSNAPTGGNFLGGTPMLKPLGPHGGPAETMPPEAGSPVIDQTAGTDWQPATDQRGMARTSGSATDIGAVEIAQLVVNTLVDENDGHTTGGISLRDAVAGISSPPLEMIRFAPSLNGGTILLGGSPITIISPSPLSIDASNLPAGISVSGNHLSPVFGVLFSGSVTMDGLTLRDAASGALHADWCNLTLRRMKFLDNHNPGVGGALSLMSFDAFANLEDCLFAGNQSDSDGGAVSNRGNLRILNCTFSGNNSDGGGGAIWSGTYRGGYVEIRNSTFSGNQAAANGGAINAGSIQLIHSTVTGNTTLTGSGGGVFSEGAIIIEHGAFNTINSIIAGNSVPDFAGVIQSQSGNNLIGGDPMLAPLGDYGGRTPTCPPLPGSPAIDAAPMLAETPATDQRGTTRPIGPLPDIGAVEAFPFSSLPMVDTDSDGIDDRLEPAYGLVVGDDDSQRDTDGDGSRDAEELANMTDPADPSSLLRIIAFAPAPGFDPGSNPVFDLRFTSFPGLSYTLECADDCRFDGSSLRTSPLGTAGDSTQSVRVLLHCGRDFVRIRRNP